VTALPKSLADGIACVPTLAEILHSHPDEFVEHHTDIAAINLACASGLPTTERLDIRKSVKTIDAIARWVERRTGTSWHIYERHKSLFDGSRNLFRIMMMTKLLGEQFGVRYNPLRMNRADECYDPKDVGDHFISGIIEKRQGTCATLPVFAVAVGRRLGYPLKLVKVPDHILFRWEDECERFNLEYNGGPAEPRSDEYYETWPIPWTPEIRAQQPYAQWLCSETPRQEVANFLVMRMLVLDAYGRTVEAIECLEAAERYNPQRGPLYHQPKLYLLQKFARQMKHTMSQQATLFPQAAIPAALFQIIDRLSGKQT
jgi:hypothetical protein